MRFNHIKTCFVCHGKKHHLSNCQLAKIRDKCKAEILTQLLRLDIHRRVTSHEIEDKTWKFIKNKNLLCTLCKGNGFLLYPQVR